MGAAVHRNTEDAADGDREHRHDRFGGEFGFEVVVAGFAWRQFEPPAVIVDEDVDVVGVVNAAAAGWRWR
jgi:hypothetical protein